MQTSVTLSICMMTTQQYQDAYIQKTICSVWLNYSLCIQLMEQARNVGIIEDNAVVDFLGKVNMQVLAKSTKFNNSLAIESVIQMLL